MITVIAGTDRKGSNSGKIAKLCVKELEKLKTDTFLIDLQDLDNSIYRPENYGNTPKALEPIQEAILNSKGIITVVPEYNGSYPGALKYFIDLLKFPESLANVPCAFAGVSAGIFGSLRSIEQLQMVYQYRNAIIFNKYVLFPKVHEKLSKDGSEITDNFTAVLFTEMLQEFNQFVRKLSLTGPL